MSNVLDKNERNGFIDFWKLVAAVGVILVHAPFQGIIGKITTSIGVCGVGFFYLISGYACYGDRDVMCKKILKRLKRNGIITVVTLVIYLIFAIVETKITGEFNVWSRQFRNPQLYIRMILLGDFEFMYGSALWFMIALLYSYIIFYFIVKFNFKKLVYIATPIFLIIRIVVETYVNSYDANWHISANLIVGALPMMLLGYLIAEKKEKILNLPNFAVILLCLISTLGMFVTVNLKIGHIDISQIFKILCAASIFVFSLKTKAPRFIKPFAKLGREDSLYIYLCHFLIIVILADLMYIWNVPERTIQWQLPLSAVIFSLIFAQILSVVFRKISLRFQKV